MAARTSTGVRLHIVTGKGGTGKTTVAAAMAMALAAGGHRVLLVEVEERQGISQTFDVPPLATEEVRISGASGGGEVWGLSVDAKTALIEYLHLFYKLGRAGGVLERFGAVDFATTIAPGVRDVLLTGKVYEANRRRATGRHSRNDNTPAYDAIVLDAPPTGRVVRFLSVNEEVSGLAKMGPIRSQADSITEMLTSPQTAVHVVTLLEEMPVQETVDAVAELRAARLPIGTVVINQVREPLLRTRELASAAKGTISRPKVRAGLGAAGLRVTDGLVEGLLGEARDHALRVAQESEQLARLEELDRPMVRLPINPEGVDASTVREFADLLVERGWPGGEAAR
jgi:anion-transporting  ArsA/GET3 family ATPase